MKNIHFYKFQASGNDFILIQGLSLGACGLTKGKKNKQQILAYRKIARKYCQRKISVGADGLLVIEPSTKALFKMRIFNPDGSEAEMCGNGARCAGLWAKLRQTKIQAKKSTKFETKAGIIESQINLSKEKIVFQKKSAEVKIKMTDPFDLKFRIPLKILGNNLRVDFVNTGVPHVVVFVENLEIIDVNNIGRAVRLNGKFKPAGTNVNFVEIGKTNVIRVRTYERGVEAETLACGTGSVASAVISSCRLRPLTFSGKEAIKVKARSGETLKVYFSRKNNKIDDIWLEGKAYLVYEGNLIY